jgi:hypothetical protein
MSLKQFSDSTLLELVDANGSGVVVSWKDEWKRMFERYRALEDKFEALAKPAEEAPVDIQAICKELAKETGDSVCYRYWSHFDFGNPGACYHEFYSSKTNSHTGEKKTIEEAIAVFRGMFEPKEGTP